MVKIGDYVRNKKGEIGKVVYFKPKGVHKYDFERYMLDINNWNRRTIDIIKSSPNIIDLIEVGDYVNGVRVEEVSKKEDFCFIYLENGFDDVDNDYVLEYGIVTKEQFERIIYKIGG